MTLEAHGTAVDQQPDPPPLVDDGSDEAAEAAEAASAISDAPGGNGRRPSRSRSAGWQKWSRLVHSYTSMIALLLVLFFGISGITLNHPDWTFGDAPTSTSKTGTMTFAVAPKGAVDYLAVSEFLRDQYAINAPVSDYSTTGTQGSISYRSPGYAADATFDTTSGAYRVTIEQQGWVGVMNDLHKGRDATDSWHWTIDLAGGFLVLIALSGLLLQLFLRRRRRSALIVAGAGVVIVVALIALTL
ncbi:PepSY-associated TM helix domain-containing protein [Aquihabitans sp. McL0605]|uniref:PepSY-associated TM helix domain-containing protein n=1 Tax=Aquihabitans sp. McL0605 TaxID=3415671 RepID=UPI003CF5C9CE